MSHDFRTDYPRMGPQESAGFRSEGVCQPTSRCFLRMQLLASRGACGAQSLRRLQQPQRGHDRSCPRPLHGFTLVELLVVIAIIALLIALLLPSVQGVREAARQVQCGNNLKQVALACLAYDQANGVLPAGSIVHGPCCVTRSKSNWAIDILPMLEQQSLHDRYDFTKFNEDPENAFVREAAVAVYCCPTDIDTLALDVPESGAVPVPQRPRYRRGSYRASTGLGDGDSDSWVEAHRPDGQYRRPARTRGAIHNIGYTWYGQVPVAAIRDGTSSTLLVGEHATVTNRQRRSFWAYSFAAYNKSEVTPESRTLLNDYERCVAIGGSIHGCKRIWSSMHPGIMKFAMCDGSVHSLSNAIDINVLGQLATIAGNETVQLP